MSSSGNSTWKVIFRAKAKKQLTKIDRQDAARILHFLKERIEDQASPRVYGKPLKGTEKEFWRYRVGGYRLICDLQDNVLVVLVLEVGHRRQIYQRR
jgi:mRNA interferase RelE/StbE